MCLPFPISLIEPSTTKENKSPPCQNLKKRKRTAGKKKKRMKNVDINERVGSLHRGTHRRRHYKVIHVTAEEIELVNPIHFGGKSGS